MRLWHYKLIPFLPKSQLVAQWRELNSIFKKQDKHILINYVYEYNKRSLAIYTQYLADELKKRNIKIKSFNNLIKYFRLKETNDSNLESKYKLFNITSINPFPNHHTNRYLCQCFANLQEKYDRGQKNFSEEQYKRLEDFVLRELSKIYGIKPEVFKL